MLLLLLCRAFDSGRGSRCLCYEHCSPVRAKTEAMIISCHVLFLVIIKSVCVFLNSGIGVPVAERVRQQFFGVNATGGSLVRVRLGVDGGFPFLVHKN